VQDAEVQEMGVTRRQASPESTLPKSPEPPQVPSAMVVPWPWIDSRLVTLSPWALFISAKTSTQTSAISTVTGGR